MRSDMQYVKWYQEFIQLGAEGFECSQSTVEPSHKRKIVHTNYQYGACVPSKMFSFNM